VQVVVYDVKISCVIHLINTTSSALGLIVGADEKQLVIAHYRLNCHDERYRHWLIIHGLLKIHPDRPVDYNLSVRSLLTMKKQTLGLRTSRATSSYQYDYLVFIGRFHPFHLGHQKVVTTALAQAERVIVLVGSSAQPRCIRNPWTYSEREQFILSSFPKEVRNRLIIAPRTRVLTTCPYFRNGLR